MGEDLDYNCRLALSQVSSKNKTSYDVGLAYRVPPMDFYDRKKPPKMTPLYECRNPFTFAGGYKTCYGESYDLKPALREITDQAWRYPRVQTQIIKPGNRSLIKPLLTEYSAEYPIKELKPCSFQGTTANKLATCSMITTGRDERDPANLMSNVAKHLDIYVTTSRMAHRQFSPAEQLSVLEMKNIIPAQDTVLFTRQKGFGPKYKSFIEFELERRDRPMVDKTVFRTSPKIRNVQKFVPRVPNYGMKTVTQEEFSVPTGFASTNLFGRLAEYPETIIPPTAKQTTCAPAMYKSEQTTIHEQKSPQAVV